MKIFQKGFNYSQDGPGNRLVYHLQGCNMRCPWCSNPEGMERKGVLVVDEEWILESICPHFAIKEKTLDRSICDGCIQKECITEHCTKGIRLSFTEISISDLLDEIMSSVPMFYDGGGVTFTGGEATLQFEELREILYLLKQKQINTCIETNGSHVNLTNLYELIDCLIMDCKLVNSDKHRLYTGISNRITLENIKAAVDSGKRVHIRVPLIGEVNTTEQDLGDFVEFFKTINGDNVSFEILTYHEYGRKKWKNCGKEYLMDGTAYVSDELRDAFISIIKHSGCRYLST